MSRYKIGEVAGMLATSVRTIRYYEEEGLVTPIRTAGGTRLYAEPHIERLRAVLSLAKSGFSVESIRVLCTARERCATGDQSSERMSALLDETMAGLDRQIAALTALKQEMLAGREVVRQCLGCGNVPSTRTCPECPVRKRLGDIGVLNLVWDQEG